MPMTTEITSVVKTDRLSGKNITDFTLGIQVMIRQWSCRNHEQIVDISNKINHDLFKCLEWLSDCVTQ